MSFIEHNRAFQQWAGQPRVDPDSGVRSYGSVFGPEVSLREDDNYLHLSVFIDPATSDGLTAGEWFGQFFDPSPGPAGDDDVAWEEGW